MTYRQSIGNKITSVFLAVAILFTMIPVITIAVSASDINGNRVADPSTMDGWKNLFPITGELSTENAGGVWMDKSVFTNNRAFEGTGVSQNDPDSFLVALSVMAANKSITGMSHVPTDSILVLDVSGSMNRSNNDVAKELVQSANASIRTLLTTNSYNRVGVVLYSGSSSSNSNYRNGAVVLLPLNRYTTGSDGQYLNYEYSGSFFNSTETISLDSDVRIESTNTRPTAVSKEVYGATYMQRGIITALEQFMAADGNIVVEGQRRQPVMVLMSDGAPSLGSTYFTDPGYNQVGGYNLGTGSGTSAALGFVSQLSAAYAKAKIEEKYGTDALFYTLGLGLSNNDTVALGVLDPDSPRASTALSDFWAAYNTPGTTSVTVQGGGYSQNTRAVNVIDTPLEQNYVDRYFEASGSSGNLANELSQAFEDIIGMIQLQSGYYPTLVSEDEDHSGYISFVDRIGQYMEVTDIKGVLIDNYLFSGADLASNFVPEGGELGTWDKPSELGVEMVAAVCSRLGISDDNVAAALIRLAYENGQLSYTDDNNFSNYIGWYANRAGEYLGFYNEGTTILPSATGDPDTDPAFVIRSYGYLGAVDASHGVSESNMMYSTVQVRKDIASGDEIVTFAIPASLIPTVTYNVTLDEDGNLSDLTVSGADNPIRLVYEVALSDEINSFNIKEIMSDEYLSDPHNVNPDGTVNLYTNQWNHENKVGYGNVNTYSYFNPSRQNDKYYYLEDTAVYSDDRGTLYTGDEQPSANGTFYRSYLVYKNNGELHTETVYRELSNEAKATAIQRNDGSWYIPKGNVHVNLDGYTIYKSENLTNTLKEANVPFVDTENHSIDDIGYEFYVGATLGNNGRITITPETGIRLSKTMENGVDAPNEAFTFVLKNITDENDNNNYPARLVEKDGTEIELFVSFENGFAILDLHADDVLYIGGMTADNIFRIVEEESVEYIGTSKGLSEDGLVTVIKGEFVPVSFINDERGEGNLTIAKEVTHEFGVEYQIPQDKIFTMEATLSGIGTANATFTAEHSGDGAVREITTDENGKFTVRLAHDEKIEIFGLPSGTEAVVVEQEYGAGFTPSYWDNGERGDGAVTVMENNVVSVIVKNDYTAAEVYPVNITVSGNKHLLGANWQQEYSFSFKLEKLLADGSWQQIGDIETASYGDTVFDFSDGFENEKYTEMGNYYYRIVEIEPEIPLGGFSYDKTVHSFSVHVGDADMDGQLEITEVVSDRPDTTVVTKRENGWNVNANFKNTYSASGTATVTIDVTKTIANIGGADKSLAGYTFGLFDAVTNEMVSSLTTTERGFARFVLTYDAKDMSGSEDTYNYILREIIPEPVPAGWSYSTDEKGITVKVMDNGDGTISAVISANDMTYESTDTSVSTTFTNTYDPTDALLNIDFVNKELRGRALEENEFTFEVHSVDLETMNTEKVLEGKNNADGKVVFNDALTYDKAGSYYYWIMETSDDGYGVTTDKATYRMIVTVTDNNGALEASYSIVNATSNTITFVNNYKASSTEHSIEGTKDLTGRELINDEFTFVMTELTIDGKAVQEPKVITAKNQSNGIIHFPVITYDKAGVYVYSVEELLPEGGRAHGITYDATVYKVTVVVLDNGEGELVIDSESVTLLDNTSVDAIIFENEYEANPTWAQFSGNKTLTGKVNNALVGGEFEFVLYNSDSNWTAGEEREKVRNGENGVITFSRMDFLTDEDQYFLIGEVNGGQTIDGITYDDTIYRVWVEVTDDLKGQLHATIHIYDGEGIPQDSISFVNIYEVTGGADVTLGGEKIIEGREWKDDDSFVIELFEADENYNAKANAIKTATADWENRNYSITLNYTAEDTGNTYYYILRENNEEAISGLIYSDAVYKIKVVVEDDNKGGVKTTVAIENTTDSSLDFVNTYTIVTGTSAQFEATKVLEGKDIGEHEFSFDLFESNSGWEALRVLQTKENNGRSIVFDRIEYSSVGDYYYIISEQKAGQTINGITYDDTVYRVWVEVTDNLDGTLSNNVSITKVNGETVVSANSVAFVNTYSINGEDTIELSGTKIFNGRQWNENDVFVIELYNATSDFEILDAVPVATAVTGRANGKFAFTRSYDADDVGKTFHYVVKERNGGYRINGITYSDVLYKVSVTVSDGNDGTVDAVATVEGAGNDELNFINEYTADKTEIILEGNKSLETVNGVREMKANDFTFDLYETNESFVIDGVAIQSVKNDENGRFVFESISVYEAGTYYFVVKENSQNPIGGVVYDNTIYHIAVIVTDGGNGNLMVSRISMTRVKGEASDMVDTIVFVNQYNAAVANVTIDGSKTLSGRELVDGEFRFLMIEADENYDPKDGAEPMVSINANGKFTFDTLSFTDVGTYYFIVSEDATADVERVSFDNAVYFVAIEITDDENGKLVASAPLIVKSGSTDTVEAIEFTNVYIPKPDDLAVDINIVKTVVNKGSETITAEGFEFLLENTTNNAEDVAVKSDENGKAKFTLSFSEDDIGKTFIYKLTEVNDGRANVTYSNAEYVISVNVVLDEQTNNLVAITTVNQVETDVVEVEFENIHDYTPEIPDPPKPGDSSDWAMMVTLMFISGGAAITLFVSNKKKRRETI